MVKNLKFILSPAYMLMFALVMIAHPASAHNGNNHQISGQDASLNAALHWLELAQNADGTVTNAADIASDFQATAQALTMFVLLDSTIANRSAALSSLQNSPQNTPQNTSQTLPTERLAQLLIALHQNAQPLNAQQAELLTRQNNQGGFGAFAGYDGTALDTSLALLALQQVNADTLIAGNALAFLSSSQLTDGAFSLYGEQKSVIATAMVLQAMRSYLYTYNISAMMNRAIDFLYAAENTAGGWGSAWETALVLQALIPLTTDVSRYQSALDALKSQQSIDGDWDQQVYTTALAAATLKLLTSIDVPDDPQKAVVAGRVVDAANGAPITALVIDALDISTETVDIQSDGRFTVSNMDADSYVFAYSAPGYLGASQNITLQKGQFVNVGTVRLSIAPTATLINGVVTDATSGDPIAGANVSAVVGSQTSNTVTDINGAYQLLAEAGQAQIQVSAASYHLVSVAADLVAGMQVQFSPSLLLSSEPQPVTSALFGRVIDEQNQPVPAATILIAGGATTTTDTDGMFEFTSLNPDEINLQISKTDYESVTLGVVIPEKTHANIGSITLRKPQTLPSTSVSGQIIDMVSGNPVAAASVVVGSLSTTTDTNGFYRISDIPLLEFIVAVNAPGYLFTNKQVSLAEHSSLGLDINIRQADLGSVSITAVTTDKTAYGAYDAVVISATLKNDTALTQGARLYVKVKNTAGIEVASFSGAFLPPLDPMSDLEELQHYQQHLAETIEEFPPTEQRTIQLEQWWNTLSIKPDTYTVTVQALDSITSNLVSERSTVVTVEPTRAITLDVKASPGYVLLNNSADIEIAAELFNRSNSAADISFDYRLLDPDNQLLTQGSTQFALTAAQTNHSLALSVFPYSFNASGYYQLEIVNITGATVNELTTGAVFVPPSIRLQATQSLDPNEVVPLEGIPVNSKITITGVDGE